MPTFTPTHTLLVRLLAVLGGGFLGGALRYMILTDFTFTTATGFGVYLKPSSLSDFLDIRLLVINTVGVFVATWLLLGGMGNSSPDAPGRLFWTTGILGGLTTYSSLIGELGLIWGDSRLLAVLVGIIALGAAYGAGLLAFWLRRRWGQGSR
jgi:fluoride ion exporter CrcB/FEX